FCFLGQCTLASCFPPRNSCAHPRKLNSTREESDMNLCRIALAVYGKSRVTNGARRTMRAKRWLLAAVSTFFLTAPALAGTVIYTDEATFLAHTQPGYYTETFTSLPDGLTASPQTFSKNGFAYAASSISDFYVQSQPPVKWLSGLFAGDLIKIIFTSGN